MKAIEMETVIDRDGKLPPAFQEVFGRKARVIVLYQEEDQISLPEQGASIEAVSGLMELAGKITAFREIEDAVAFQRQLREEWSQG